MGKREQDNLTREAQREQAVPRRPGGGGRLLALLLVFAAVLGVVGYAAYRGIGSADSLRRKLSYKKVEADEEGKAELYRFGSDRSNQFAMLDGKLLVVSQTRMALVAEDGEEVFSQNVKLTSPAIALGAKTASVYDVGGESAYLLSSKGLLRDLSAESGGGIVSININPSDYMALTAKKSGYKTAVTVFDPSGAPVFTFNSSDRYVMDACVTGDCRHVAAVKLGEQGGSFASVLAVYALDSETPLAESTLTGTLVLSLSNLGNSICAIEDDRLTTFRTDGTLGGSYRYEYPYLRARSTGSDEFTALLLSRYRSGSAMQIVTLDAQGEVLGTKNEQREVLSISAAGKYLAVLYSDSLSLYTSDLTEFATLSGTDYAREVIMRSDGTAVLVGSVSAWLYIP